MFISIPDEASAWLLCLENLLPSNMIAFWSATYDYQYGILGIVITPYIFLPIFALIPTMICSFFAAGDSEKSGELTIKKSRCRFKQRDIICRNLPHLCRFVFIICSLLVWENGESYEKALGSKAL